MRMTPSKCSEMAGIGSASPGPGRKFRRSPWASGGGAYASSFVFTSTVTSTRNEWVVCHVQDSAQRSRPRSTTADTHLDDNLTPVRGPFC